MMPSLVYKPDVVDPLELLVTPLKLTRTPVLRMSLFPNPTHHARSCLNLLQIKINNHRAKIQTPKTLDQNEIDTNPTDSGSK